MSATYIEIMRLLVAQTDGAYEAALEARRVEAEAKAAAEILEALAKFASTHTDLETTP